MNLRMLAAFVALAATSCAYKSDYVVPGDGRARVVWRDGEATAALPTTGELCRAQAKQAAGGGNPFGSVYARHAVWVDVPVVVAVHHHHHHEAPPPPVHEAGPVGPGRGPSSKPDLGKLSPEEFAAVAVAAIVSMPIVAISLAQAEPGTPRRTAGTIDLVNAFNDLSRTPGNACSAGPGLEGPGAPPPAPPEAPPPPPPGMPPPPPSAPQGGAQ